MRRVEFYWAIIAFADVVLLGTLQGIIVAVIASLLTLAQQAYNPSVYALGRKRGTHVFRALSKELPDDETWAGLLIVRIEGRLFFANAQRVADMMRPLIEQTKPSVLLLDFSAVIDLEYTAPKMLIEGEEQGRREGTTLWLASLNAGVRYVVEHSKLGETLGQERIFVDLQAAVETYEQTKFARSDVWIGASVHRRSP